MTPNDAVFLNITRGGLIFFAKSPNDERITFINQIVSEAKQLVETHGDAPSTSNIEQTCDDIENMHVNELLVGVFN